MRAGSPGTAWSAGSAGSTALPYGGVVVVLEPSREGDAGDHGALLSHGARLAGGLGVTSAALTWDGGAEPDLEALCSAIVAAVKASAPRAVLMGDGDLGRQLAPMVASDLHTSAVLGCCDVLVRGGEAVYVKPVCGGWLEREFSFTSGCLQVATVEPTVVPAGPGSPPEQEVVELKIAAAEDASRAGRAPAVARLELTPPDFHTVDLVHARRIVGAGSGGASDELLAAVADLAELLEGSVGATRPVVDDGCLPKERLIGQTGRTVAPDLYLALGISGSPHHIAGVQGAAHIVAVNRDEHAPIVSFSDASYVGELEDVLPALLRMIREWRDGEGARDARGV